MKKPRTPQHARAALSNPGNRFHAWERDEVDDGWHESRAFEDEEGADIQRVLNIDHAKTIITYNTSPDVPFDRSINPYRGCEHGCIYCFARPSHAYLDLSPGLDFETRLFYKPDAAALLRKELDKPSYHCQAVALGINTDAYQPIERQLNITRQLLQALHDYRHPVGLVTKSLLVERDIDILQAMAQQNLVHVMISLTTLDRELTKRMEPRACPPQRRLDIVRRLSEAGIPTGVLIAPVIPVLTDHELEHLVTQARDAGAQTAGYVLLRMPHEIKHLFYEWLQQHYPLKAEHIKTRMRDCHQGSDYQSEFGQRMRGSGAYAQLISQRFSAAVKRNHFPGMVAMETGHFSRPGERVQMSLFEDVD